MNNLEVLLKKADDYLMGKTDNLEVSVSDLLLLARNVSRLVSQVHYMNAGRIKDPDLCPVCACYRWGRTYNEEKKCLDFETRSCSNCSHLRPNPPDEKE